MIITPRISVIVPVHNGGSQLQRCIEALLASDYRDYEILVVNDGSTDESADIARACGVRVLDLVNCGGPAAARNRGAALSDGEVVLFIDADVVARRDTLARVAEFFRDHPTCAAVFGSYDDSPAAENFVSQFKNLLHHFVHQRSRKEASTFWAGCGAVRREAFLAVNGFDEVKFRLPSIEDIELGQRLRRSGFRIILDPALQVTHLKRWTFLSLLRTDVRQRALPWSRLILAEDAMIDDLNLRKSDRLSAVLAWLALGFLGLSFFSVVWLLTSLLLLASVFLLNLKFYHFLNLKRGRWFAFRGFGMLLLHYFYSSATFAFCSCSHVLNHARRVAQ